MCCLFLLILHSLTHPSDYVNLAHNSSKCIPKHVFLTVAALCAALLLLSTKRISYKVFIKFQLFQFCLCLIFSFCPFVFCLMFGVFFVVVVVVMFLLKWSELSSVPKKMMCLVIISPVKINPSFGQPAEKIAFPSHGFVVL